MEIGRISGTVTDSSGARVARAQLSLQNPLSGRQSQTRSDDQGQFQFENVPYGAYVVRASADGFSSATAQADIRSNVVVRISFQLTIAANKLDTTVRALDVLQRETPRTEVVIDENAIARVPAVVRRDQLQALVSTTPGWNTENDGLMHIRGVDDGTLYVVGGVPTPDRVDGLFAGSFNTDAITSLDIIIGNIPAEFGDRSGAVVLIQPKSGLDIPLAGTLSLGAGSFDAKDIKATVGAGTKDWGLFFAGSAHNSDRFLDPVDPAISITTEAMSRLICVPTGWPAKETSFVFPARCRAQTSGYRITRVSRRLASDSDNKSGTIRNPSSGSTTGLKIPSATLPISVIFFARNLSAVRSTLP